MTIFRVDVANLYAALDKQRIEREMSWRQLSDELGLSQSTLSRLQHGCCFDAHAYASALAWLGQPPAYIKAAQ